MPSVPSRCKFQKYELANFNVVMFINGIYLAKNILKMISVEPIKKRV